MSSSAKRQFVCKDRRILLHCLRFGSERTILAQVAKAKSLGYVFLGTGFLVDQIHAKTRTITIKD